MPLDYAPERGKLPRGVDVAFGVIQATGNGMPTTARAAIERRLVLHGGRETCHRSALLLPPNAPDLLDSMEAVLDRHEKQQLPEQRDLLLIFTMRFDAAMPAHRQFRLACDFAYARLARERNLAVVMAQHQPGLAGWQNKPHCHAFAFARELHGSHFLGFTPLVKPGAKAILAAEWADWLVRCG